jgi:universal stress protein E
VITIRRILCPVDFSEFSRRALAHAAVIAGWYEAELVVVHVIPIALGAAGLPPAVPASVALMDPEAAARDLREFVGSAAAESPRLRTVVTAGPAAASIVDHARELDADLLVLGTHGRSGFERFMLGSVTEKAIRKASCPVLTVPPAREGGAHEPVFRRIVCAIDFSEASARALQYAASLAAEANGRLTLIHVLEWMPEEAVPLHPQFDVNRYREALVSDAKDRLARMVPEDARDWTEIEPLVRVGKPYREILGAASAASADLVVLGVQGRGPIDRMLFGSTAQHVVREASCPVLTVRP